MFCLVCNQLNSGEVFCFCFFFSFFLILHLYHMLIVIWGGLVHPREVVIHLTPMASFTTTDKIMNTERFELLMSLQGVLLTLELFILAFLFPESLTTDVYRRALESNPSLPCWKILPSWSRQLMVAPSESWCGLQGSPQPDFSHKTGQFDMKSHQKCFSLMGYGMLCVSWPSMLWDL